MDKQACREAIKTARGLLDQYDGFYARLAMWLEDGVKLAGELADDIKKMNTEVSEAFAGIELASGEPAPEEPGSDSGGDAPPADDLGISPVE